MASRQLMIVLAGIATIILIAPAGLAYSRTDTALVADRDALSYSVVRSYNGNEAQGERDIADADGNGFVTQAEADAYAAAIAAAGIGNATGTLRWDNTPTTWSSMTVTTTFLANRNADKHSMTVTLDGEVSVTSLPGIDHLMTLIPPPGARLDFSVAVPANWTIVTVSGANVTSNSSIAITGNVGAGGLAVVQVREPAPPPPPDDVTPPAVDAGADRDVVAGDFTSFNGSATDDDPGFPVGASFWWTFTYNATPVNLTGRGITFTFWAVGTYALTFTAMDRSGNRAEDSIQVAVSSPDTVAPTANMPSDVTVEAGTTLTLQSNVSDNDPAFPAGARFAWSFAHNGTPFVVQTADLTFTFWGLGTFAISFTATDAWQNTGAQTVRVTVVSPDTVAPTIDVASDMSVKAGQSFSASPLVTDNDPLFPAGAAFLWTFVYNSTALNIPSSSLWFTFWSVGTYALTFSVTDPWGNRNSTIIHLTVERPDMVPPAIDVGPARAVVAGTLANLSAQVSDDDPLFPEGGTFHWSFLYDGIRVNLNGLTASFTFWLLGIYSLTFTATDAWGNSAEAMLYLTVTSPDISPPSIDAGADAEAAAGIPVAFHAVAFDDDPTFASRGQYFWTFNHGNEIINLSGKDVAFTFEYPGQYTVRLEVRDGWGNFAFDDRVVTVSPTAAGTAPAQNTGTVADIGFILPLALAGMAAASAFGVVAYRRRNRAEAQLETVRSEAASASTAAAVAPTAVLIQPAASGPSYVVEGLLILYKDGRLIHHQSPGNEKAFESPEVLGSMFTAVTEFIRDSFGQEGALSRLTYGQNTIILDRSAHLFGAVIVYGEPDNELRDTLRDTLRRLESAYAGVVEWWYGDRDAFPGMEALVAPIFSRTAGMTRATVRAASSERTVKLVSGTEHYKGYLRLRVAIANQTDGKLSDATVTVVFNQNVLRLAKIEPAGLERQGLTVRLGDVAPGERVGAIYYLDPQNCSRTTIEGIATYTDAAGEAQNVSMKPRTEEIVCPMFFTPGHANPGMMKRLIENSLAARDSKLYRVLSMPAGTSYKDVFAIVREAVQRHHVLLIRNIAKRSPYDGKAWFYGQTKNSKSPVIIRAAVSEERRAIEIFVAVDSPATLTGLLAEFHRTFTEMVKQRTKGVELEPVMDDALKGLLSSDEIEGADAEGHEK